MELSIVLPCRNEEKALPFCLKELKSVIKKNKLDAEIIVSDSSSDSSAEIAKKSKVKLVKHDLVGYGNAYLEGFKAARGKYIIMVDADGSYDFKEIPKFLEHLRGGYDFVIGNRFSGNLEKGAMPWHHKHIGNPALSFLLRLFFGTSIRDVHCGMRGISKSALGKLNLRTAGMEFASEMVIKALRKGMKIKEIGINYRKRIGKSKLKSFSDGWRHLRFMLLYSPMFLFLIPGVILFFIGAAATVLFSIMNPVILGKQFFIHPMFITAALVIVGYQLIIFSVFAKTYAVTHLEEKSIVMKRLFGILTIEKASIFGLMLFTLGLWIFAYVFSSWATEGYGALDQIKSSIVALIIIVIGIQTVFSAFMLSILGIKNK